MKVWRRISLPFFFPMYNQLFSTWSPPFPVDRLSCHVMKDFPSFFLSFFSSPSWNDREKGELAVGGHVRETMFFSFCSCGALPAIGSLIARTWPLFSLPSPFPC